MPIDINRGSGGTLPPDISSEILAATINQSVVQRLVPKIPLPGRGAMINVITGEPVASFVNETDAKPVSTHATTSKILRGYMLSVIEPFSNQFKRDRAGLYDALVQRLPYALGNGFDKAVLYGFGAPTGDFDTLAASPSMTVLNGTTAATGTYTRTLSAMQAVTVNSSEVNGFALNPAGELNYLGALDLQGRPIFNASPLTDGTIGQVLGRPVYKSKTVNVPAGLTAAAGTLGFAGDWSRAVWGQVGAIDYSVSEEATIVDSTGTVINLWQRNMFAIRIEVEVGFRFTQATDYVRLTNAAS